MLFRIFGHWILQSSLIWPHLFHPNNWGQLQKTEGASCLSLCGGSLGCFRSIRFSLPGGLWRGSRHVVCGLNSASSEKAVGEVGNQGLGEEQLRNLGIWFSWAFIGKSLHLPLRFTFPFHHLLHSVQSDLCLFKIQPPLLDSVPAVSHPPGLMNPESCFQLWSGWGDSQRSPKGGGGCT